MKAQTSLGELTLEFRHVWPDVGGKMTEPPQFQNYPDAGTYCLIKDENNEIVGQGRSTIHPNDMYNFDRGEGRKISLRNAVRKMYLPKEDRQAIWNAYFNRNVVPKQDRKSRVDDLLYRVRHDSSYELSNARGDLMAILS